MSEKNGFDRYLEFQYGSIGSFYTALFHAISKADTVNSAKLAKGFPEEVEAYRVWTQEGVEEFLKYLSPNHRLRERFKKEYNLLQSEGQEMTQWACTCGQVVYAESKPEPLKWTDGHVCHFLEVDE